MRHLKSKFKKNSKKNESGEVRTKCITKVFLNDI